MPNKIVNGDFSSSFSSWMNGYSSGPFVMDREMAAAQSDLSDSRVYFSLCQEFHISDEVLSAYLTVFRWAYTVTGFIDGYCKMSVYLQKPDSSWVNLSTQEWGGGVNEYGNSPDQMSIGAYLNATGNYKLLIQAELSGALVAIGEGGTGNTYEPSILWVDDVSVNVLSKKTASVSESLVAADQSSVKGISKIASEDVYVGGELTDARVLVTTTALTVYEDCTGFEESISAFRSNLKKQIDEEFDLSEVSSGSVRIGSGSDAFGFIDSLVLVRRISGSVVVTYSLLNDQKIIWVDGVPMITPWLKESTVIN